MFKSPDAIDLSQKMTVAHYGTPSLLKIDLDPSSLSRELLITVNVFGEGLRHHCQ